MGKPDPSGEREELNKKLRKAGKCTRCPPHGGMDNSRERKPKSDRYKSRRKGR